MKKKSVKVTITIISLVVHIIIGLVAVIGHFNGGFWGVWFASFNGTIAIFTTGNVLQKKIISENYRPELDQQRCKNECVY